MKRKLLLLILIFVLLKPAFSQEENDNLFVAELKTKNGILDSSLIRAEKNRLVLEAYQLCLNYGNDSKSKNSLLKIIAGYSAKYCTLCESHESKNNRKASFYKALGEALATGFISKDKLTFSLSETMFKKSLQLNKKNYRVYDNLRELYMCAIIKVKLLLPSSTSKAELEHIKLYTDELIAKVMECNEQHKRVSGALQK